jgi:leucyl-tRNA synthetase
MSVWWCEELKTVLANEEVINGRSERGNYPCVRRPLRQWMLRITAYAERLLADLEDLDWPESIKAMQREWIGRSEGAEIEFGIEGRGGERFTVFTTRPDTLFGATFCVLAPEHPLVASITTPDMRRAVEDYVAAAASKSDLERTDLAKDKSGVFTGAYALNPLLPADDPKARVPIWIADYVLISYGTGAIMAVPGHDTRDHEFARKYDLPVVEVVRPPAGVDGLAEGACFTGDGTAVSSPPIEGLATPEAKRRTIELLEAAGAGRGVVRYKLRDWLFSRQRYWGEPFPLLHLEDGTIVRVPDDHLPVRLPEMDDFTPSSDGSAPLARAKDWLHTVDPASGKPARRDTDTMPGWAGSCWYWLRFMDPGNAAAAFSHEAERYWGPVDLYVGGATHAVLHLLYARFWHKVMYDAGLVHTREPFRKLFNQGLLGAPAYQDAGERWVHIRDVEERDGAFVRRSDGASLTQVHTAMSKSKGNVVNPDDVIAEYGADTFRLYEMFMSPLGDARSWDSKGISGCRRFLERAWRLLVDPDGDDPVRPEFRADAPSRPLEGGTLAVERALNRCLKRVDDSFGPFSFNTAIAGFMTFLNDVAEHPGAMTRSQAERFVLALAPFAPHFGEELWERLGHDGGVTRAPWPKFDPAHLEEDTFELVVQVLGKVRGRVVAPRNAPQAELERLAAEAVAMWLEGKSVLKTIVVPGRLVNFVVR